MEKSLPLRLAAFCFALVLTGVLWAAGNGGEPQLSAPTLHWKTAEHRRLTLDALQRAWDERPDVPTPSNARAEKDFINTTATFLQRTYRKEIGLEADAFYRKVVHDFFDRYGSEEILGER